MNRICFALSKLIHINYVFSLCCDSGGSSAAVEDFSERHSFLFILYIPFFLLYLAVWSIAIIYEALFFHAC